jgi:hypothetical protein
MTYICNYENCKDNRKRSSVFMQEPHPGPVAPKKRYNA